MITPRKAEDKLSLPLIGHDSSLPWKRKMDQFSLHSIATSKCLSCRAEPTRCPIHSAHVPREGEDRKMVSRHGESGLLKYRLREWGSNAYCHAELHEYRNQDIFFFHVIASNYQGQAEWRSGSVLVRRSIDRNYALLNHFC